MKPKDLDKGMKNLKLDIKNNRKNVIFTWDEDHKP